MTVNISDIYAVVQHKTAVIKRKNATANNAVKYLTYATSYLQNHSSSCNSNTNVDCMENESCINNDIGTYVGSKAKL
jgi:hypothetical protein